MFTYRHFIILLLIAVLVGVSLPASTQPSAKNPTISVISWNAESGVVDPAVIAQRLAAFDGSNLWGLVEVNDTTDAATFGVGVEVGESANFAGSAAQSQPLAVTIPHDHAGTELQSALSNRVHSVHAARPGCGDISFRNSTVLPRDPHRFDGNHEALGYES